MTALIALAILAIACCGYLTLLCVWSLRIHALRSDSQRLIYLASSVGFVCLVLTFILFSLAPLGLKPCLLWFANRFGIEYLDQFIYAFALGPTLAYGYNYLLIWRRRRQKYEKIATLRESILLESLQRTGDMLMPMLARCFERNTLLQVNLKSRKVYCGVLVALPLSMARAPTHLSLLPKFSTVRNKDTLIWESGRTNYPAFEKYKLVQRVKVIDKILSKGTGEQEDVSSTGELVRERKRARAVLKEFESLDIEDWFKLIPLDQIETISPFDEEAYELWFAHVLPSTSEAAKRRD